MPGYDPLHRHRRLWLNPDTVLDDSMAATVTMHQNLIYLKSCKAIVRRDCNKLNGKVKIIGGGTVIDGPPFAGFVGSGMLTAAAMGLHGCVPSIPTSDAISELINYVAGDKKQAENGILLIIHDCAEYYLNFFIARNKAEEKGIPIKMVVIRDELNNKLNQRPLSPRSPSGMLLVYKIAGAMSEEGRSLDEIYNVCNKIVQEGCIFSVGAYIAPTIENRDNFVVEISRGDRLSDRHIKRLPVDGISTNDVIEYVINNMICVNNSQKFPPGSKLAVLLNYFGGFTELEANIAIKDLINQLKRLKLDINVFYTGSFYTSIEVYGFHLSLLNLSCNTRYSYYLNAPTSAYSWPETTSPPVHPEASEKKKCLAEEDDIYQNLDNNQEQLLPANVDTFETDILLAAVEFACEALIACAPKIDMLDKSSNPKVANKCGTRLADIAKTIKAAIQQKQFADSDLSSIMFQIARIFEQNSQDPQTELYTRFLKTLGKSIEDHKDLEACDWLDAFVRAIRSVDHISKGSKFSNTLYAAKTAFCDAYALDDNVNVILALGQAVNAAQKQTSHIIPESGRIPDNVLNDKDSGFSGLAGAHAIGVWMRGAYEGIKLKCSRHKKRVHHSDSKDDDEEAEKMPKLDDPNLP